MSQRRVIEEYGRDMGFTIEQLSKLVATYKVLVDSAASLNVIALASKSDVKDAIKRTKKVGYMIDGLIQTVDFSLCTWEKYMSIKSDYINCKLDLGVVEMEIDEQIKLQG